MLQIVQQLKKNKLVFLELLQGVDPKLVYWKQEEDKWCLLEILCHLYDEEQDLSLIHI